MQIDPTHYEVLQVREDASPAIIKAAHRELMRSLHPDVNPASAAQAAAVNHARHVLADPERRDEYDHELDLERQARARQSHQADAHGQAGTGSGSNSSPNPGPGPGPGPGSGSGAVASEVWGEEVWGEEVPWAADDQADSAFGSQASHPPPDPASSTAGEPDEAWGSQSPYGSSAPQGVPPPPGASAPRGTPRGRWTSHLGILAWVLWWLGVQVFIAVVTRTGYADIALALGFVTVGWLAARKRARGGRIGALYVIWLLSGVILVGLSIQTSIPAAVLWGVVYVSWVAAAEGSHRLSRWS